MSREPGTPSDGKSASADKWGWRRVVVVGFVIAATVIAAAVLIARKRFNGAPLGGDIAAMLNSKMRGRIEIGAIQWPVAAFEKAITGGWVSIEVNDIRVFDDCAQAGKNSLPCGPDDKVTPAKDNLQPRKLILSTPKVTADIDIHALMIGNHDIVLRNVTVHGGQVLLEEADEPYPLYPYDKTVVSLLTAFYPRDKPVFRAGIYADKPPPIFDLRDLHLIDVDLYGHFGRGVVGSNGEESYGTTIIVKGINLGAQREAQQGFFYMDGRDPLAARMYLSTPLTSKGGVIRMLDYGPPGSFAIGNIPKSRYSRYQIELTDLTVRRLAQQPEQFASGNYLATTLHVDVLAHTKQGGELKLTGRLFEYFDRPFGGLWDLKLEGRNLGPTLHAEINEKLSGDNVVAAITLTGPFIAPPKIAWQISGLEATIPIGASDDPAVPAPEPLALQLATLEGSLDLVNDEGVIEQTVARVKQEGEPGELTLAAKFTIRPYALANVNVDVTKPIDIGRFVPPPYNKSIGRYVSGRFSGMGDTIDTFKISELDAFVGRTRSERGIRLSDGSIDIVGGLAEIQVHRLKVQAGETAARIDGWMCTGIYTGYEDIAANDPKTGMSNSRCLVTGSKPPEAKPRETDIRITKLESSDLASWLRRLGKPPIATGLRNTTVAVSGPLDNPVIAFSGSASNVMGLGNVDLKGELRNGKFVIDEASSRSLGGNTSVSGTIALAQSPFIENMRVRGRNIDLAKVPGLAGKATGTVDVFDASVRGSISGKSSPFDYLDLASFYLRQKQATYGGESFADIEVCVNPGGSKSGAKLGKPMVCETPSKDIVAECLANNRAGKSCGVARATRTGGGVIEGDIMMVDRTRSLSSVKQKKEFVADLTIGELPVGSISALGPKPTIGGLLTSSFRVTGTFDDPVVNGFVALQRAWVLDQFLGDVSLRSEPSTLANGKAAVSLSGSAHDGQVGVLAKVGTSPPYEIEATITARRFEIDGLVDLKAMLGIEQQVRGWTTGTISITGALAPPGGKPTGDAWIELTELEGSIERTDSQGRPVPLRISAKQRNDNRPALSIHATPEKLEFACRSATGEEPCSTTLSTFAGDIELKGNADRGKLALVAYGKLDLSKGQKLLEGIVSSIAGTTELAIAIGGSLAKPTVEAELRLADIIVLQTGQDTALRVPSGLIRLANNSLGFSDVRVRVDDPALPEQAELVVKGGIGLDGFLPAKWSVIIEGKLAGKLLLAVAPQSVSQASGVAAIEDSILLSGKGRFPNIDATLTFASKDAFTVIPRKLRRELAFVAGSVEVSSQTSLGGNRSYQLGLGDVAITIDGEGRLRNIRGEVDIAPTGIESADISLDASSLALHSSGTLDLSLSGDGLRAIKPSVKDPWQFSGDIAVVNGRYFRNIELGELIRPAPPPQGANRSFDELFPEIANATLQVGVSVRRFSVANNIADIDMDGELFLSGTPRDPRLSGSIKVLRGTFRLQGTRVKFTRTSGTVDFTPNRKFPADTPELALTSEADFRDQQGTDHLISLVLGNTLSQPTWDLRTSTGYNKAQTLALIFTGRTPDQIRGSLGDQSIGVDPGRIDPSTNTNQGLGDQVVKDLVGDWVSSLFRSPLEKILRLDVLRFELAFNSIGFHGERKIFENLTAIGDAEQTFRGSTVNGRVELRTPLGFTLQGSYLSKDFNDPAEQDIKGFEAKLVFPFYIP